MPTVPSYDDFHATPTVGGVTPVQTGYNPEAATGDALQQLGQGMSSAGTDLGKIALDAQDQANQVRVNDAPQELAVTLTRATKQRAAPTSPTVAPGQVASRVNRHRRLHPPISTAPLAPDGGRKGGWQR